MVSKLEDSLLRSNGVIRRNIFRHLDGTALRRLRSLSRVLHDLVDHQPGRLFWHLYIDAPLPDAQTTRSLEVIAPLCHSLTIKIGYQDIRQSRRPRFTKYLTSTPVGDPIRRSQDMLQSMLEARTLLRRNSDRISSSSTVRSSGSRGSGRQNVRASIPPAQLPPTVRSTQIESRWQWTVLFSGFPQLNVLNLRINGDPAWPGCTEVEDTLVTLRMAVEHANLPNLRTLCLAPVHAMGIIHVRWLGVGAFGEAQAAGAVPWSNIDTLDLRIYNPFVSAKLTGAQETMFKKILYDYLRSFAPVLRCLRLVWLGGSGPSPLTLHLEQELTGRPGMTWPRLEELWLGNIDLPWQTIKLTSSLAPSVTQMKMLRSVRRDSSMEAHDSSAWIEVERLGESGQDNDTDRASSVYSQSGMSEEGAWEGGISRSSMEVPFMLDI